MMNDWLVQTKLYPPRLRADIIPRPRLLEALYGALQHHRLTLLSAPAGYGKTTLLAALSTSYPQLPLVWLSLDETDNDPARFLPALLAALQRLDPACGVTAQRVLTETFDLSGSGSPGANLQRIVGLLINDLLNAPGLPDPFVLVLDDLHLITEPSLYLALDYLLEQLPPAMRVAIATRHDPPLALARLRARGQLAELRLADLRFTSGEATIFLNEGLGLALSPTQLATLQGRTEGWAAGLRLLAGSLSRMPTLTDRDRFIHNLLQTDRYIFDFLAEEVLRRQEPEIRRFLLETSLLPELTPALCRAVSGRADAADILEMLYHRNLFLIAVEATGPAESYRYHALFAEFLQRQLAREGPERLLELHHRAAQAETIPTRAIEHYLKAQLWEAAAGLIEQAGEQYLQQGSLLSLRRWLEALPPAIRAARPNLNYLLGVCAWRNWELESGQAYLEEALAGFEAANDAAGQGKTLVYLAYCHSLAADFVGAAKIIEEALAYPIPPHSRVHLLMIKAEHALNQGQWSQALTSLEAALALAMMTPTPQVLYAIADNFGGPFTVLPGGLAQTKQLCQLISLHLEEQVSPLHASLQVLLALTFLWRGRWDQAVAAAGQAMAISEQFGGMLWVNASLGALLPVVYALKGDNPAADQAFDQLFQGLQQSGAGDLAGAIRTGHLYWLGRIRWLQGRLTEVQSIYQQMVALAAPQEFPFAPLLRRLLSGLLALSERRYSEAEQALREAAALQNKLRFTVLFSNARLLLAYLYLQQGREAEALAELEPVLAGGEAEGAPGLIMWEGAAVVRPLLHLAVKQQRHAAFAAEILALLDQLLPAASLPLPAASPQLADTQEILTPRELEVLRLLAAGASNPAIAEQLVLSLHTVKRHVAHILQKLDASSRTEAAIRARDLGLL